MFYNYLKTFFRNLFRQKLYAGINILGLAIGIAATLLIALYIFDELSYDRFHKDADRIYRLGTYVNFKGNENWHVINSANLPEVFAKDFPEAASVLRIRQWPVTPFGLNDKIVNVEKIILADSNFFSFFSFKLLEGNPGQALIGKNKIVLTESTARSLFGYNGHSSPSPIGKLLLIGDNKTPMEVTGIAADAVDNSHFHFNGIISMATVEPMNDWYVGLSTYDYFKVRNEAGARSINNKLNEFSLRYMGPEIEKITSKSLKEVLAGGDAIYYFMQPLTSIHLDSHFLSEMETNGDRTSLKLLAGISLLTIVLACINFVNLVTARAINRAKEIGVRKAIGAIRQKLISQFLLESFLYTTLASLLAVVIVIAALHPFNIIASKSFEFADVFSLTFLIAIGTLTIIISIVSGLYPAFYITALRPVLALKGVSKTGQRGLGLRNSLVVFQFMISIFMVITTLSVYDQISFLQSRNPGFEKENVICIRNASSLKTNADIFRNQLKASTEIVDVSFSSHLPSEMIISGGYRKRNTETWQTLSAYDADEDHLKTLGLTMRHGRFFSKDHPSDSSAVVLNSTAAELLNISDTNEKGMFETPANTFFDVIGIVNDFNFETSKSKIKPLVIFYGGQARMAIRVKPGDNHKKLSMISELWSKNTDAPFEYSFLDENLMKLYYGEVRLQKLSGALTVLSIFIACMGLLGLITYIAGQRTKEIGIRKILGASVQQVAALLSKDFVKLVIIAFIVSIPLSWFAINRWLEEFAYHIGFNWAIAALAGMMIVVVAIVTVSFQAVKSALINPIDTLRNE